MMFTLHLLFLYIKSQCPRYSLSSNPEPFLASINLPVISTNRILTKDHWPSTLTVHCSPATLTPSTKSWYSSMPINYANNNESAILNLELISEDYKIINRPTCSMSTNNHICLIGTSYPLYFPQVSLLLENDATVEACGKQQFALRVVDAPANVAPFVMWRKDKASCDHPHALFIYDTIYIDSFDPLTSGLSCTIFGFSVNYKIKQVSASPNCMGSTTRIMFPRENDVIYYYQHQFYYDSSVLTVNTLKAICFPLRKNILLLDSNGETVQSFEGLSGTHKFSCAFSTNLSNKVDFSIVFPRPPAITVPLQDCMGCDNKCSFSFDYNPGDSVDPVTIYWFYNGEELLEGVNAQFTGDRRGMTFPVYDNTGGNIQAVISNSYGTQMTSAYVVYTAPPFFELDLPRYGIMESSTTTFTARVKFTGQDKVKMWWKMNGKIMDSPVKHVTPTVNLSTHTCILTLDEPVIGTFSCVFQAGSCLVESTTSDFSTTEEIRKTVSLMMPVLGVLGAAVLLAIVLIPLCVVYRNRHSRAYRLALVERECGLNPDKDFQTMNDFGENSRRQARNNAHFSILPSAPGSNEGSVLPYNNMPDIKEQASFVNDYQP